MWICKRKQGSFLEWFYCSIIVRKSCVRQCPIFFPPPGEIVARKRFMNFATEIVWNVCDLSRRLESRIFLFPVIFFSACIYVYEIHLPESSHTTDAQNTITHSSRMWSSRLRGYRGCSGGLFYSNRPLERKRPLSFFQPLAFKRNATASENTSLTSTKMQFRGCKILRA